MKKRNNIILSFFLIGLLNSCDTSNLQIDENANESTIWQWKVHMDGYISSETDTLPEAYLWIPEDCKQVRGVVFAQNNMIEEGMLEDSLFRARMRELNFAEVWISPIYTFKFDFHGKDPELFQDLMDKLAHVSGYSELSNAPVVPMGHSACATFPWNFAAWNPERTLCVISLKGDSPQTYLTGYGGANVDWDDRNIDGVPGLFTMGEDVWWEDRIVPGFKFQQENPKSVITWTADAGHGHFDYSPMFIEYVATYIQKAAEKRLGESVKDPLKKVQPESGWLTDRWIKESKPLNLPATYDEFRGDRQTSSWVFDKQMADLTEKYYAKARAKKQQYIGFKQNGQILKPSRSHTEYDVKFNPASDGITFHVKAFFSDSTQLNRINSHASTSLHIDPITGPVRKVNDSTFHLNFGKLGFDNKKRSNKIWLVAHNDGDSNYKSVAQQIQVNFPLTNTEGEDHEIDFPVAENVLTNDKAIPLKATSSKNLPVNYYVKYGPAYIKNDSIFKSKIPPRTKYPVKIVVVAWQYGIKDIIKTAHPVEREFIVHNKE